MAKFLSLRLSDNETQPISLISLIIETERVSPVTIIAASY